MKGIRHIRYSLCAFLLLSLLVSCSGSSSQQAEAPSWAIQFRPQAGTRYPQRILTRVETTQEVMGQSTRSVQEMEFGMVYEILSAAGGQVRMRSTYDWVRSHIEIQGQQAGYDSRLDTTVTAGNASFAALVGANLVIQLDTNGHVQTLEGLEAMIQRMVARVNRLEDKDMLEQMFRKQYETEEFRRNIEYTWAIYPGKRLHVGETWEKKLGISSGIPVETRNVYTLQSVSGSHAIIGLSGEVKAGGDSVEVENGVMAAYDLKGTQTGSLTLNLDTGWIEKMNMKQEASGDMKMMGYAIPMKIITTAELE